MNARDHRMLVAVITLCFMTGCMSTFPAPKIQITQAQSEMDFGRQYARAVQSGYIMIQGTGRSMLPYLGPEKNDDVLLCTVYDGRPLSSGAVVCYQRQAGEILTAHMVVDKTRDGKSFYITGTGNHFSDGWHPKSSIRYIVHGTIRRPGFKIN